LSARQWWNSRAVTDIIDDEQQQRFEATVDGRVAELTYRVHDDRIVLVHTGVPDELGGHGLGGELVRAAVRRARAEGLTVVPRCTYARKWLEEHATEVSGLEIDWETSQ
jgi:predicted GNAT family acetyltransferase